MPLKQPPYMAVCLGYSVVFIYFIHSDMNSPYLINVNHFKNPMSWCCHFWQQATIAHGNKRQLLLVLQLVDSNWQSIIYIYWFYSANYKVKLNCPVVWGLLGFGLVKLSLSVSTYRLLAYCKSIMKMCLLAEGHNDGCLPEWCHPPLPAPSTEHSSSIIKLTDAITVF